MNNSHDPLTALHGDELVVQPDPAFAARLRSRLEGALNLPNRTQGVDMSGTDTAIAELSEPTTATGLPKPAALPYLTVANARDAIAWYVDALGAVVVGEPFVMADGRIGHAELALSGGVLYLADEYPEIGLRGPAPQANSVSLMLEVPDTDAALERAREAGAQVQREPYEDHGSRGAAIIDPFGHRWMLSGPITGAAVPIQHGDVGYVSVWTP
ncbi:MAG TPA: VOC family protein, partial [Mycobacterium sp.]